MSRSEKRDAREPREFRRGHTRRRPPRECRQCGAVPAKGEAPCGRLSCLEKPLFLPAVDAADVMEQGDKDMSATMQCVVTSDGHRVYPEALGRPAEPHYRHDLGWVVPVAWEWELARDMVVADAVEDAWLFWRQCPGEPVPSSYRGRRWEQSDESARPSYFAQNGTAALEPYYVAALAAEVSRLNFGGDLPS